MTSDVWNKSPNNTNASYIERKNQDGKHGSPLPIRQCLVSMYKLDKAFCAKFLTAKVVATCLTTVKLQNLNSQQLRPKVFEEIGQH